MKLISIVWRDITLLKVELSFYIIQVQKPDKQDNPIYCGKLSPLDCFNRFAIFIWDICSYQLAQPAGAVEYTDCFSAEE